MNDGIGNGLRTSYMLWAITAAAAICLVTLDMWLSRSRDWFDYAVRVNLALVGCLYLGFLASRGNDLGRSIGFRFAPKQGWIYWLLASAAIGIVFLVVLFVIDRFSDGGTGLGQPQNFTWRRFVLLCFMTPLCEEVVYRMLLCPPLAAAIGFWGTVVVAGTIFALLHQIAGVAAPDNQLGGLFLTWAFLKSETILVPLLLHSIGNAFTFVL